MEQGQGEEEEMGHHGVSDQYLNRIISQVGEGGGDGWESDWPWSTIFCGKPTVLDHKTRRIYTQQDNLTATQHDQTTNDRCGPGTSARRRSWRSTAWPLSVRIRRLCCLFLSYLYMYTHTCKPPKTPNNSIKQLATGAQAAAASQLHKGGGAGGGGDIRLQERVGGFKLQVGVSVGCLVFGCGWGLVGFWMGCGCGCRLMCWCVPRLLPAHLRHGQ